MATRSKKPSKYHGAMTNNERKTPLSLWLMPAPQFRAELQVWVDDLSGELGSKRFPPHITIVGDVQRPFSETATLVKDVAASTPTLSLSLGPLDAEDMVYKSLFLVVSDSAKLDSLQTTCADLLGPVARPQPHLSLAYSDTARPRRWEAADKLGIRDRLPLQVTADLIQIWHTPPEDFAAWDCLTEVSLAD